MVEFFSKPSAICTKWCAQTFSPIFGFIEIFDRNFAKIVAPPSDECENYVLVWKTNPFRKKRSKPRWNRPINGNSMRVRTMHPWNARRSGLGAWQHFRTYSRRALYDRPQTLHGDRARRAHQKNYHSFFDPTYNFSYRVHGKKFELIYRRAVSQQ